MVTITLPLRDLYEHVRCAVMSAIDPDTELELGEHIDAAMFRITRNASYTEPEYSI